MVEVLVAMIILIYAAIAALGMYDAAWKSFKRGENAVEQQQAVRIGFDKLVLDLQMAGFNHNPDGDDSRPDEQIEAAFDTAIVIRADFDAPYAADSATPETALAGGQFETVSTGNDEIVTYVLAKPDGSSTDTLTFEADVKDTPRDGVVETISIPNVALVHDDPPYTLYRVTLNDSSTWGSGSFIVRTPLTENIRSMSFRYFNTTGAQINSTFDLTTTGDDIGGSETAATLARRAGIYRVEVDLIGLTRDPDLGWADRSDTNATTQAHRKFRLTGDATPRNKGLIGVLDPPAN
jgi:hypothetical protein